MARPTTSLRVSAVMSKEEYNQLLALRRHLEVMNDGQAMNVSDAIRHAVRVVAADILKPSQNGAVNGNHSAMENNSTGKAGSAWAV